MARPIAISPYWFVVLAVLTSPALADGGAASTPSPEQVARGMRLLQMQGCISCHSLDGSPSAGPSLAGRYGSLVSVRVSTPRLDDAGRPGGEPNNDRAQPGSSSTHEVLFDRRYLQRSLTRPDEELAEGFAPGVMPTILLTEEQVDAVVAALQSLRPPAPKPASPLSQGAAIGSALLALALLFAWRVRVGVKAKRIGPPGKNKRTPPPASSDNGN